MSTYVLNPNGTIQATITGQSTDKKIVDLSKVLSDRITIVADKPVQEIMQLNDKEGYSIAIETLGSFKSGKNFAETDHNLFDGVTTIPKENIQNGVIGESVDLYSYAHGNNMILKNNSNSQHIGPSPVSFYKSYNSFFDLDGRISQNESGIQIFATDLDFLGIPQIFIEPNKILSDVGNTVSSLGDFLIAAIIPITTMSILQGLIQSAQSGPPDPFGLLPEVAVESKNYQYGKYITYVRIDEIANPLTASIVNPIIDGAVSLLNTMEKVMGFPKNPIPGPKGDIIRQLFKIVLQNLSGFILGYILYLVPGFKLGKYLKITSAATFISLLVETFTSIATADKAKHNYNLLVRKIVRNNYFREKLKSGRTISNSDGTLFDYPTIIDFSSFFYKFVGQRISAGIAAIQILGRSLSNKANNLFAISKMNELPEQEKGQDNSLLPVVVGPSVFDSASAGNSVEDSVKSTYFNRSIYSLTSLVTNEGYANSYLKYHDMLTQQNDKIVNQHLRRLPQEHVKKIEEIIDSDYMPFSIQDLRTNEVFKFHAFVENYSDSFSPEWEDAGKGFGRMDSIKIYKGTSRNITVDFHLIAMNPEDFDNMWYMINRLIALIYPQWSKPVEASATNSSQAGMLGNDKQRIPIKFGQPFTQIPMNSPIIRLKLGDLFTSNYSKKNLARIFGFEQDPKLKEKIQLTKNFTFKELKSNLTYTNTNTNDNVDTYNLKGYAILDLEEFNNNIRKIKISDDFINDLEFNDNNDEKFNFSDENFIENTKKIYSDSNILKLYESTEKYYYNDENKIDLEDVLNEDHDDPFGYPSASNDTQFFKLVYLPFIIKEKDFDKVLLLLFSKKTRNDQKQFSVNYFKKTIISSFLKNLLNFSDADIKKNKNLEVFMQASGDWQYDETKGAVSQVDKSENKINNPVVKSFESNMGEGLAGTVSGFGISYDQSIPWQLDKGSRAPMAAKINLQMSVIHDILPGLDHNGVMRAPTYRVGGINREMFGGSVRDEIPVDFVYKE